MNLMNLNLLSRVLDEYDTPIYLFDVDFIGEQYNRIKECFPDNTEVAFAVKSNYSSEIVKMLNEKEASFDVFSEGELWHLGSNKCDLSNAIYTSVSETEEGFDYALKKGVRKFVLGSINGIKNFSSAVENNNISKYKLLLRVQPLEEVSAKVSTSGIESKFGVTLEKYGMDKSPALKAVEHIKRKGLNFDGFHFHLGSQVSKPNYYVEAIDNIFNFVKNNNLKINTIDLGGGYPYPYTDKPPSIERFGEEISKKMKNVRRELGNINIIIEPGRFLVAGCGNLITKVQNVKEMYGRKVVILDISEDMVSLDRYDIDKSIKTIPKRKEKEEISIGGNLCHSADWIIKEPTLFPIIEKEDLFIFEDMGAYISNHNIPYNLRKLPKILSIRDDNVIKEKHPISLQTEITKRVYNR